MTSAHAPAAAARLTDVEAIRHRIKSLAWLLDSSFQVPGTKRRIGLDALIGLVPGIGDVAGAALSAWIIAQARAAGAPGHVIARMTGNVALETVVGLVPILGDLFDLAWKANLRNVALLDRWLDVQAKRSPSATSYAARDAGGRGGEHT